jgi:hypothetical protein
MHDEDHEGNQHYGSGGGILGLIIFIALAWWIYSSFIKTDYSKPWWDGTANQRVCVVHNPDNDNCYTLPVTAEEDHIVQLGFPDGGYVAVASTECGKAVSFEGQYCVITDVQGGDWQVESN